MSTLHQTINSLASEFAHSLLRALRGASLEEILAETAPGHAGGGRRGRAARAAAPARHAGGRRGGRLRRRTPKDIQAVVGRIVSLLQANKKGLRAEEIRSKLGLDRREIPRPLAEALKKKLVSKRGRKRATTYFAGGKK
jgi:CRP-like cAMP-binding protein